MKSPIARFDLVATGLLLASATITGANAQAPQPRPFSTAPARSSQQIVESTDLVPAVVFDPNVNVTNESGAQSETSVAVDPTNPMHILESVNDLTTTAAMTSRSTAERLSPRRVSLPAASAMTLGSASTAMVTHSFLMSAQTSALRTRKLVRTLGRKPSSLLPVLLPTVTW